MSGYWKVYYIHFYENKDVSRSFLEREYKMDKRKYCLFTIKTLSLKYSVVLIIFLVVFLGFSALFNNYVLKII